MKTTLTKTSCSIQHIAKRMFTLLLAIAILAGTTGIIAPATANAAGTIPMYTVLVLDVSPSMADESMAQMKAAAHSFVRQMFSRVDNSYIAVVPFSQGTEVLCEFSSVKSDIDAAIDKVDSIYRNGTNMYAGFETANKLLSAANLPEHKVKNIFFFTDGIPTNGPMQNEGQYSIADSEFQNSGWFSFDEYSYKYANAVYKYVKENLTDINIYTLGFFQDFFDNNTEHDLIYAKKLLTDLQNMGVKFVDNGNDLEFAFEEVVDEIIERAPLTAEQIEIFAGLAESAYTMEQGQSYQGYTLLQKDGDDSVRFSWSRFETNDSIVYAFRGTPFPEDFNAFADWGQTLGYYLPSANTGGAKHIQYAALQSFVSSELRPKLESNEKRAIYLVGHSLGGWLSQEAYLLANQIVSDKQASKIKGVVTFNMIGISKDDASKILSYYNSRQNTEIKNYYVCCDVARWYGKEKGFEFPGENYVISEPHWQVGIRTEADGGTWYQHAHDKSSAVLLKDLAKIKSLTGKTPLTVGLKWFYYGLYAPWGDLPLDGIVPYPEEVRHAYNTIMVRIDSHTHYKGLTSYAVLESNAKAVAPTAKIIIRIACPVDVTITANGETLSSNTATFNGQTSWGFLTLAGVDNDEKIVVLNSDSAKNIKLNGTGNGEMSYSISYYDSLGRLDDSYTAVNVQITPRVIVTSNTANIGEATLNIDTNGDGTVDNTMKLTAKSKPSDWAVDSVKSAIAKGFVPGELQGNYQSVITRAEFCRMSVKWLEYATGKNVDTILAEKGLSRNTNAFTDTNDPDILAAFALGITNGTGNNQFTPNGNFTREQAATMIRNVCKVIGMDTANLKPSGFVDIGTASDWAVEGINFVRANGIMNGTGNNNFTPKGTYTRQESIVTFDRIK